MEVSVPKKKFLYRMKYDVVHRRYVLQKKGWLFWSAVPTFLFRNRLEVFDYLNRKGIPLAELDERLY